MTRPISNPTEHRQPKTSSVTAAAIRAPGAAGLDYAKEALVSYLYHGGSIAIREALLARFETDESFAVFARVACFTLTPVVVSSDNPTTICRDALDWVDRTHSAMRGSATPLSGENSPEDS